MQREGDFVPLTTGDTLEYVELCVTTSVLGIAYRAPSAALPRELFMEPTLTRSGGGESLLAPLRLRAFGRRSQERGGDLLDLETLLYLRGGLVLDPVEEDLTLRVAFFDANGDLRAAPEVAVGLVRARCGHACRDNPPDCP